MAHGIMATRALQSFGLAVDDIAFDFRCNVFVTAAAGVLGHFVVELGDLNRVGIVAAGEIKRVPESVVSLHCIFADNVMGCMAVVARRCRVMARLQPSFILCLHHMTVGARLGIIGQIGIPFGVDEGISAKADRHSNKNRQCDYHHR